MGRGSLCCYCALLYRNAIDLEFEFKRSRSFVDIGQRSLVLNILKFYITETNRLMATTCSCINIHIHSCLTQWSNETRFMFKSWVSRAVITPF